MPTELRKPVRRKLTSTYGNRRLLIVELKPGDVIEFRPAGCRIRYALPLAKAYNLAVLYAANKLRLERAARRKAKRAGEVC